MSTEEKLYEVILKVMEELKIPLTKENVYSAVWLIRDNVRKVEGISMFSFSYNYPFDGQVRKILSKELVVTLPTKEQVFS